MIKNPLYFRTLLAFRSCLLILIAFALLGTSYYYARSLGMAQSLPPHSFTRAQMSIGVSLFKLTHGADGYLLYTPVVNALVENGFKGDQILTPGRINEAINLARSLQLGQGPIPAEMDWGDDKGYSDFTTLAFRLFGFRIEALFNLYFVLLGTAAVLFALRFYDDRQALFVLVAFLAAHLLVVQVLPNSGVTSVVHDSRFLPAASFISMLHCMLATVRSGRREIVEIPLFVAQTAILILVLNGRSSSIWQLWAIGFALAGVLLLSYRFWDKERFWTAVLMIGILISGVLGLNMYKDAAYDLRYRSANGTQAHVIWHNVYMGLGFHPDAIRKYELLPDDSTVYQHAYSYLLSNPEAASRLGLSGTKLYEPIFVPLGWGGYDKVVREMFFEFIQKNPKYVAEAFLLYKPRLLLETIAWQLGLKKEFPNWVKMNPVHGPASDLRLEFFRFAVVTSVLLAFLANIGELARKKMVPSLLTISLGALFSLIPCMAVGPFYYELPVVFLVFAMMIILAVALLFDALIGRFAPR